MVRFMHSRFVFFLRLVSVVSFCFGQCFGRSRGLGFLLLLTSQGRIVNFRYTVSMHHPFPLYGGLLIIPCVRSPFLVRWVVNEL